MARPQKPRTVSDGLPASYFKPQGIPMVSLSEIVLTLDGHEALRLVDVEGLDQQEAALRMNVSRSTLSRILGEARRTTATAITAGLALRIEGGSVTRPQGGGCGHKPKDTVDLGDTPNTEGSDQP